MIFFAYFSHKKTLTAHTRRDKKKIFQMSFPEVFPNMLGANLDNDNYLKVCFSSGFFPQLFIFWSFGISRAVCL